MTSTTTLHSIELQSSPLPDRNIQLEPGRQFEENQESGGQLAPTDGGPAAWKLLWAAFTFEAILWGKPTSHSMFRFLLTRMQAFPYPSEFSKTTTQPLQNLRAIDTFQ
jgi:hypothetical protein